LIEVRVSWSAPSGHRLSPDCRQRRTRARDSKEGGQQSGI